LKNFALLIFLLVIVASFIIRYTFNYDIYTILYHLLLIVVLFSVQYIGNFMILLLIKNQKLKSVLFHLYNYLFLTFLILFYLLVLSSNVFWKKTITLKIIKNYFFSLDELIRVIPVEKWLLLSFPMALLLITTSLYYLFRPNIKEAAATIDKICRLRPSVRLLVPVLLIITVFVFRQPLIEFKRQMHFAEEPLLIFFAGPMWQGSGEELAFDRVRYENGKKDLGCITAIKKHDKDSTHYFVVILIDALRSDHLSVYGYNRKTTPFLDSLYTRGDLTIVKNAFSTSNNTIGGVSGLFYSKEWDKFGYNGLNIFKFLKKIGYTNYAFLTGFHKEWYGLSALYRSDCDVYYESSMNFNKNLRVDDDLITLNEFKKAKFPSSAFIYLHLLSAHHVGKKHEQFKKYLPDKIGIGTNRKEALVNNYDNGILQCDYVIREVMVKLQQENMLSNTTLFIVADHGEMFGDENSWSHGGDIHGKVLEVPLLVYDQKKLNITTDAGTLMDVGPTIADRIGYPVPDCWQGYSLMRHPNRFELRVFSSDDHAAYPYGILNSSDNSYTLKILDAQRKLQQTLVKKGNNWVNVQP
jgi:glucan phosphoethanolaminetransferase (alkaline phosphatase superfamily)